MDAEKEGQRTAAYAVVLGFLLDRLAMPYLELSGLSGLPPELLTEVVTGLQQKKLVRLEGHQSRLDEIIALRPSAQLR